MNKKLINTWYNEKLWSYIRWAFMVTFLGFLGVLLMSGVSYDIAHLLAAYFVDRFGEIPCLIGGVFFVLWCISFYVCVMRMSELNGAGQNKEEQI